MPCLRGGVCVHHRLRSGCELRKDVQRRAQGDPKGAHQVLADPLVEPHDALLVYRGARMGVRAVPRAETVGCVWAWLYVHGIPSCPRLPRHLRVVPERLVQPDVVVHVARYPDDLPRAACELHLPARWLTDFARGVLADTRWLQIQRNRCAFASELLLRYRMFRI